MCHVLYSWKPASTLEGARGKERGGSTLHSEMIACANFFFKNYFLRNCAKLSQSIARNNFFRIIFVRLRELVVALCFLAVSIDALPWPDSSQFLRLLALHWKHCKNWDF